MPNSVSVASKVNTSNLFEFVAREGNGVKGLIDSGLSAVPDLYIQPEHQRIHKTNTNSHDVDVTLPLIDLSQLTGPHHDQVSQTLVKAAQTLGFFYVVNHGLDIEFLEELKDAAHTFFNQPLEKKVVYLNGASRTPLVIYGTSFVPDKQNAFEWMDYCSMFYTSDDEALKDWPDCCKEVALKYLKTSTIVAKTILQVLMGNLGVDKLLDDDSMERKVNMNLYPTCPEPELTVGIGRHSDFGLLTVLLQDGIGGLSIKLEEDGEFGNKGEWIEVPPVPGSLVVNIGDSLQVLSNGRYKSAEHQARTNNEQSRVSIPFFMNPSPSVRMGPLPEVVKKDGEARYREHLHEEYRNHAFGDGKTFKGKKNIDFVKITSSS